MMEDFQEKRWTIVPIDFFFLSLLVVVVPVEEKTSCIVWVSGVGLTCRNVLPQTHYPLLFLVADKSRACYISYPKGVYATVGLIM